jgi:hypothetical protein
MSKAYAVDRRCLHGAPSPGAAPDAALAVSQLVARLVASDAAGHAEAQLRLLEGFVGAQPALARSPHAARILVSAAVDAFGDGNRAVCASFLRAAAFLEAFGLTGAAFLRAAHGEGGGRPREEEGMRHFERFLDSLGSQEGIARELRARVGCGCLAELPPGSAAAREQAALGEAARAEAAGVRLPPGASSSGERLAEHMRAVAAPLLAAARGRAAAAGVAGERADDAPVDFEGAAAAAGAAAPRVCGTCGAQSTLLCARCKRARYCGAACQRAAWPAHRGECRAPAE